MVEPANKTQKFKIKNMKNHKNQEKKGRIRNK